MLFDARIQMRLPGDSPEDAIARLKSKLPNGWQFDVDLIEPADHQPPPVRGTLNITLPGMKINGR